MKATSWFFSLTVDWAFSDGHACQTRWTWSDIVPYSPRAEGCCKALPRAPLSASTLSCLHSLSITVLSTEQSLLSLPTPSINSKNPLIRSSIVIVFKHRTLANPRIASFSKFLQECISRASEVDAHFLPKKVTVVLFQRIHVMVPSLRGATEESLKDAGLLVLRIIWFEKTTL